MLTKPDISHDRIVRRVQNSFGLRIFGVSFLPVGADVDSAAYRITSDDGRAFFLKLRSGNFNETAVALQVYLHARGIRRVMAPIATSTNELWIHADGFAWMLYPFFEGKNAFEIPLSQARWTLLGETMRAVHAELLPAELAGRMAREEYSSRNRTIVKALDERVEQGSFDDSLAARFAALWTTKRAEIHTFVERAEQLARALQQRTVDFVACHSDLHAGNVLVGADGEIAIVDWDEPILAPKERDLMFVGGGVGGVWNDAREAEWFYAGYGTTSIDPVALAYYRYERIVADLASYGQQFFKRRGSAEDRELSLQRVMNQFLAGNVVESAHRTYSELGSASPR